MLFPGILFPNGLFPMIRTGRQGYPDGDNNKNSEHGFVTRKEMNDTIRDISRKKSYSSRRFVRGAKLSDSIPVLSIPTRESSLVRCMGSVLNSTSLTLSVP